MELKRTAIAILCASVMLSGCTSDADQEDLLDENAAPIVNAGGADSDAIKWVQRLLLKSIWIIIVN